MVKEGSEVHCSACVHSVFGSSTHQTQDTQVITDKSWLHGLQTFTACFTKWNKMVLYEFLDTPQARNRKSLSRNCFQVRFQTFAQQDTWTS